MENYTELLHIVHIERNSMHVQFPLARILLDMRQNYGFTFLFYYPLMTNIDYIYIVNGLQYTCKLNL
jgi:hypothetical protein